MLISDLSSDVCSPDLTLDTGYVDRGDYRRSRNVAAQATRLCQKGGERGFGRIDDQLRIRTGVEPDVCQYREVDDVGRLDDDFVGQRADLIVGEHRLDRVECRGRRRAVAGARQHRSEEHTSELQSIMRTSYAVFC